MYEVSIAECHFDIDPGEDLFSLQPRIDDDEEEDDLNSVLDNSSMMKTKSANNQNHNSPIDPYKVLQVRRDATPSEIRHAYKRLALWHHPGRCLKVSREERARRKQVFEVLAACYETLLDKEARSRTDAFLREAEHPFDIRVRGKRIHAIDTSMPELSPVSSRSEGSESSSSDDEEEDLDVGPPPSQVVTRKQESFQSHPSMKQQVKFVLKDGISQPLSLLGCGINKSSSCDEDEKPIPSLIQSSSTTDGGDIHYTEQETNRLFGGPLQLLFRARRWKPFQSPDKVFESVFGEVPLGTLDVKTEWKPLPHRSSAWSGTSEKLRDGTVIFKTTRTLHDRVLIRTELIRPDRKQSQVTVTSELIEDEEPQPENDPVTSSCSEFDFCFFLEQKQKEEPKQQEQKKKEPTDMMSPMSSLTIETESLKDESWICGWRLCAR